MKYCPNIHSKEWKEHSLIFPETNYLYWHHNKGNELRLAPNGKESSLFNELKNITKTEIEALKLKGSAFFSNSAIKNIGKWFDSSNLISDENGEPKLMYVSKIKDGNEFTYTDDRVNALYPNSFGVISGNVEKIKTNDGSIVYKLKDGKYTKLFEKNDININGKNISLNVLNVSSKEIEKARKWVNDRFGTAISFNIVSNLISNGMYGAVSNAAIYLDENSDVNDVYHESFEIVFNNVLDDSEQQKFVNEVLSNKKYEDEFKRLKSTDRYKNASDKTIALELMADEFKEYMVGVNNLKDESFIKRIFNKLKEYIKNFFKSLFNNEDSLEELFHKVSNGSFNNIKNYTQATRPFELNKDFNTLDKQEQAKFTSESFKQQVIERMKYAFKQYMKQNHGSVAKSIRVLQDKVIGKQFEDFLLQTLNEQFASEQNEAVKRNLEFVLAHFNQSKRFFLEYLTNEIHAKELDAYDEINGLRDVNTREKDSTYSLSDTSIQINPQLTAPALIRLTLSLAESSDINEEFGVNKLMNFGEVYKKLSNLFSGVRDENEFEEKLNILEYNDNQLYNYIKEEIFDNNTIEGTELYGMFIQTFSKQKNNFIVTYLDGDGKIIFLNASKDSIKVALKDEWTSNEARINEEVSKHHNGVGTIKDNKYTDNFKNLLYDTLLDLQKQGYISKLSYRYEKENEKDVKEENRKKYIHVIERFLPVENIDGTRNEANIKHNYDAKYNYITSVLGVFGITIHDDILNYLLTNKKNSNEVNNDLHILFEKIRTLINSKSSWDASKRINLFSKNENSNNNGDINFIIDLHLKYNINSFETSHYNISGNMVFDNSSFTYVSHAIKDINNLTDEGLKSAPFHLNPILNKYLKNSLILNNSSARKNLSVTMNEGVNGINFQDGKEYYSLSPATKLALQFFNHKEGQYLMLQAGANKIARWFNFNLKDIHIGLDRKNILFNYLKDEVNSKLFYGALNDSYSNISNENAIGPIFEILKQYDIELSKSIITAINNKDVNDLNNILYKNKSEILSYITEYTSKKTQELIDYFINNKIISKEDNLYVFNIKSNSDNNLLLTPLNKIKLIEELNSFLYYSMISNIEQFKLFFGNPIGYKGVDDIFKRLSSGIGPKNVQITHRKVNKFINQNLKRLDGKQSELENPTVNSLTIADVLSIQQFEFDKGKFDTETLDYLNKIKDNYEESYMAEGDGASWISMDSGREFMYRNMDWPLTGKSSPENLYQYEQQRYVGFLIATEKLDPSKFHELFGFNPFNEKPTKELFAKYITDKYYYAINPHDGSHINKNDLPKLNTLKPLYYGPYANETGIYGIVKTSFSWLAPSLFIDYNNLSITRPNMYNVVDLMRTNQLDAIINYSANKGISTKVLPQNHNYKNTQKDFMYEENGVPSLYNNEGQVSLDGIENLTQKTYYQYWGIQVATGFGEHNSTVFGTQLAKQILSNIFNQGQAANPELFALAEKYKSLNNDRLDNNLQILIDKLGMQLIDGNYAIPNENINKLIDLLKHSATQSKSADNIIDSFNLLNEDRYSKLGFAILPNARNAEQILMSLADEMTISSHVNGKQSIQMPSTFFEKGNRKYEKTKTQENRKEYITTSDLDYYTKYDENGNIKSIGVYIPSPYKGITDINQLNTEDKAKLLNMIGFRIPTQSLSSIESIEIIDFLPDTFGDVIVLPTSIVKKAGSDYDIDKMYLYIKNTYIDNEGNIQLIKYDLSDENANLEEYNKYLLSQKLKISERIINKVFPDVKKDIRKKLQSHIEELIKDISSNNYDDKTIKTKIIDSINSFADKNALNEDEDLMELYSDNLTEILINDISDISYLKFKGKGIENELFHTMHEIITHKDNYVNLIQPLDGELFNDAIKLINSLNKKSANKVTLDLAINPLYVNSVIERAMAGSTGIGPSAITSAFHILAQESNLKIVTPYVEKFGKEYPSRINLKHNKDNNGIILGGDNISDNSMRINEVLKQIISAAADNTKDPKFGYLNINDDTLGTVLYLTLAGVPFNDIVLLINQPSVKQFLSSKKINQSEILEATNNKLSESEVLKEVFGNEYKDIQNYLNSDKEITSELLSENIKNPTKNTDLLMLAEFLKHRELASKVTDLALTLTYDTNSFGGSVIESQMRTKKLDQIKKSNVFNIDAIEKMISNGFIASYKNVFDKVLTAFNNTTDPIFTQNKLGDFFDTLIALSTENLIGKDKDSVVKHLYKYKNGFINYMTNTNGLQASSLRKIEEAIFNSNVGLNKIINIKRILDIKQANPDAKLSNADYQIYNMYKDTKLFDAIEILDDADNKYGFKRLRFRNKKRDASDSNFITQEIERIGLIDKNVFQTLLRMQLRQTGNSSGANGYIHLMPYKQVANEIATGIEITLPKLNSNPDLIEAVRMYIALQNYNDSIMNTMDFKKIAFLDINAKKLTPFVTSYQRKNSSAGLQLAGISPFFAVPNITFRVNEDLSYPIVRATDKGMEFKDGKSVGQNIIKDIRNGAELTLFSNEDIWNKLNDILRMFPQYRIFGSIAKEIKTDNKQKNIESAKNALLKNELIVDSLIDKFGLESNEEISSKIDNLIGELKINESTSVENIIRQIEEKLC